jgi:hypothetical protein
MRCRPCLICAGSQVHGNGPAEVHAPRQAAARYARAIAGSSPRVSNVTAKAEPDWILQAPTYRNGPCLMAAHYQQS